MNLDVDLEEDLLDRLGELRYHVVQEKVTAKALMTYSNNPLLFAVKVISFIIIIVIYGPINKSVLIRI